jgi:type VII secretion integral membrane protein EccD
MTTSPAALRGAETSRLTIAGPAGKADLAVPGMVTIGELLPMLARHVADEAGRGLPWILQRLGEAPLDPDQTAEALGLRDGDVLYLRLAEQAMPAIEFDDVAVGVASVVSGRPDRWRPDFTRRLLLGLAGLVLAAYLAGGLVIASPWPPAAYFGVAAVILAGGSVAAARLGAGGGPPLLAGLSASVFAAAAATAVHGLDDHAPHVSGAALAFTAGRLQLAALGAGVVAGAIWAARRQPAAPYATVVALSATSLLAATLAHAAHWDATRAVAVFAVVIFILGTRGVRAVLRAARLRVPHPPANAEELQREIDPEPGERLTRRTASAVAYLNALTFCLAVAAAGACALIGRHPDWAGSALAFLLSCSVLLRSRTVVGAWQRTPLAVAGTAGLAITVLSLAAHASPQLRLVLLLIPLVAAALLVVGAWRLPTARLLPAWGHIANQAELASAIALVPLLLQVLHVYAALHAMTR